MDGGDWADPNALAIALYLDGSDDPGPGGPDGTLLVDDDVPGPGELRRKPLGFVLPQTRSGAQWHAEIDSYDPAAPSGSD